MNSPVVRQALDRSSRMDYPAAEEQVAAGLPTSSPARAYFAGTICLNRFLDWGDTAALARAETWWASLSPLGEPGSAFKGAEPAELALYRGLTGFQLSFVAALRGQRLRQTAQALAARQQLNALERPEARASLLLYAHYRGKILGKLPFVGEVEFPVAEFRKAADASPALRDMFLSSLFWILLDRGKRSLEAGDPKTGDENLRAALRIVEGFLERYPDNRLAREMRATVFFRLRRFAEARTEYESLHEEYLGLKKPGRLPLGVARSAGNLARVLAATGERSEAEARRAEWNRAVNSGLGPWLPASLQKDLEAPRR
jgi:tetratricopeptide (TPR) repeat protein